MPEGADTSTNSPKKGEQKRDGSGAKASKKGQQALKSAVEIRQEEWDKMVDSMVSLGQGVSSDVWQISSHAGWLAPVITGLAGTFSTPTTTAACYLAAGLLVLLLVSPANWVPHIATPVVPLIPLQSTLMSISLETKKTRSAAVDSAQWAVFWLVWCILGRIGSWVAVFRPGWMALWEVTRMVALVIVSGPWFGRAGLVSVLDGLLVVLTRAAAGPSKCGAGRCGETRSGCCREGGQAAVSEGAERRQSPGKEGRQGGKSQEGGEGEGCSGGGKEESRCKGQEGQDCRCWQMMSSFRRHNATCMHLLRCVI